MKTKLSALLTFCLSAAAALAQSSAFTYQGRLNDGANPANGNYDLRFTLYDALAGGNQVGGVLTNAATSVSSGLFTIALDFGASVFTGADRWLEIGVRTNGGGVFAPLSPRQALTAAPYALYAPNAGTAATAAAVPAAAITGTIPLAKLPAALLTNGASGVSLTGSFAGNGSGLTDVPGTMPWQPVAGTTVTATANQGYLLTNPVPATVTLPTSANVGDMVTVSRVGDTGWQVSPGAGQQIVGYSSPAGLTWTPRPSPSTNWNALASSADGTKLVAAVYSGGINGGIYTSTNSGATWTAQNSPTTNWGGVASSADGTKLVAKVNFGFLYTSTNSGATWTARAGANEWGAVASSADGTKLVAAVYDGPIYTSTNSGVTWTLQSSPDGYWTSIASSYDGTKLVTAPFGGKIHTSTNSGVTWTMQNSLDRDWVGVAGSADGVKLVAAASEDVIYTSTDSGLTWTPQNSGLHSWSSVASSSDGAKLVVSTYEGQMLISTNAGATWMTVDTGGQTWVGVASSADASKLVAIAGGGGQIHTSTSLPGPFGSDTGTTAQFQYLGNGVWQPVTFAQDNLPVGLVTNGANGVTLVGTFSGSGAGLTNLNAANLASGKVPDARLSANVPLLNASQTFSGQNTFSGQALFSGRVGIRTNISVTDALHVNGSIRLNDNNVWFRGGGDTNHGIGWYGSGKTFASQQPDGPALFGYGGGLLGTERNGAEQASLVWTFNSVTVYGTFNNLSDRNAKQDFAPVNAADILENVARLPITTWRYKTDPATTHIGPTAQDFSAAFQVGTDERHIAPIDEGGVALAAIQGLNEKVEARAKALESENAELKARLEKLEQLLGHRPIGGAK